MSRRLRPRQFIRRHHHFTQLTTMSTLPKGSGPRIPTNPARRTRIASRIINNLITNPRTLQISNHRMMLIISPLHRSRKHNRRRFRHQPISIRAKFMKIGRSASTRIRTFNRKPQSSSGDNIPNRSPLQLQFNPINKAPINYCHINATRTQRLNRTLTRTTYLYNHRIDLGFNRLHTVKNQRIHHISHSNINNNIIPHKGHHHKIQSNSTISLNRLATGPKIISSHDRSTYISIPTITTTNPTIMNDNRNVILRLYHITNSRSSQHRQISSTRNTRRSHYHHNPLFRTRPPLRIIVSAYSLPLTSIRLSTAT